MGADDPVSECVFPFTRTDYDGVTRTHEDCTYVDNINGKPWCSTEVDGNGVHTGQQSVHTLWIRSGSIARVKKIGCRLRE